jgi:polysaccharide biosynthesis/export protein
MRIQAQTFRKALALLFWLLVAFAHAASKDYILGPGDAVKVTVYEQPDLTTEARISEAGAINFPLLGQVTVGGTTTAAVEATIAKLLRDGKFVKQPHVNVGVTQYRSQQISVLGYVSKPGKYALEGPSTVADLLALAGGVTQEGADRATLTRQGTDNHTAKKEIDLLALLQTGDAAHNMAVANGDVLYVPRAPVFYIYGEVQKPGVYRLERHMSVVQALSVGGGLTGRGTERGIKIKRRGADGRPQTIEPSLSDLLTPDDVIYVKESLF